jgi:hypothetical protein
MDAKTLNIVGLGLNCFGGVLLLIFAAKTVGAVTKADQNHIASHWWPRVGYGLITVGFLIQILVNLGVAECRDYKRNGDTAYQDTLSGKLCKEDEATQQLHCNYKVGKDLEFSIDAIGTPYTGITFTRSNIKGDYFATFGLMHGCVIVKHGGDDLALKPDVAFVSPKNGKVYKTWVDCKAGY